MADFELLVGQQQPFAYDDVLACLGNDIELLRTLVDIYEEDCPKLLREIEQGIKNESPTNVHASVHKLRGLVSNFRDQTLDILLETVERNSQSGSLADFERVLNEIRGRCGWLSQELRQALRKS